MPKGTAEGQISMAPFSNYLQLGPPPLPSCSWLCSEASEACAQCVSRQGSIRLRSQITFCPCSCTSRVASLVKQAGGRSLELCKPLSQHLHDSTSCSPVTCANLSDLPSDCTTRLCCRSGKVHRCMLESKLATERTASKLT